MDAPLCTYAFNTVSSIDMVPYPSISHLILTADAGIGAIAHRIRTSTEDIDAVDRLGRTALIHTCSSQRPPLEKICIIHWLLAAGANVSHCDANNSTPISALLQKPNMTINIDILGVLLRAGSNPNITSRNGVTPLVLAVRSHDIENRNEAAQLLLSAGASVYYGSKCDVTILRIAILNYETLGGADLINTLVRAGANVNYQDRCDQTTMLMLVALMSGHNRHSVKIAKQLIDCGADARLTDAEDLAALSFTSERYNPAQGPCTLAVRDVIEAKLKATTASSS